MLDVRVNKSLQLNAEIEAVDMERLVASLTGRDDQDVRREALSLLNLALTYKAAGYKLVLARADETIEVDLNMRSLVVPGKEGVAS